MAVAAAPAQPINLLQLLQGGGASAPTVARTNTEAPPTAPAGSFGNAPPNPMAAAQGLGGGAGTLGAVNPLAQLMQRQMSAGQPGGAGTPTQQAQAGMGQLGGYAGPPQGFIGAQQGGTTVPGTANQSPFFNASNAQNAQQAILKSGGGAGQAQQISPAQQAAIKAAFGSFAPKGMSDSGINTAFLGALAQNNPGMFTPQQINQLQYGDQIQGTGIWGPGAAPIDLWTGQALSALQNAPPDLSSIMLGGG